MQVRFAYDQKSCDALRNCVSAERLQRYVRISAGDVAQALRLYMWNIALSESLYGPMQGLEVTLRNGIHQQLAIVYGPNWYEAPKLRLEYAQASQVVRAKRHLRNQRRPIEPTRIVAELSLGFWVGLLGPGYETNLWRPHLRRLFAYAPERFLRRDAYRVLDDLRMLRNRIAHHEPILQRRLPEEHELILAAVSWLCPITASWISHHSRFARLYAARP